MSEYRSEPNQSASPGQSDEVSRVTVDEVKARMDRGEPIFFVDSRGDKAWSSSDVKIKGALRVPPDDAAPLLSEIPKDRSIVIYCT